MGVEICGEESKSKRKGQADTFSFFSCSLDKGRGGPVCVMNKCNNERFGFQLYNEADEHRPHRGMKHQRED